MAMFISDEIRAFGSSRLRRNVGSSTFVSRGDSQPRQPSREGRGRGPAIELEGHFDERCERPAPKTTMSTDDVKASKEPADPAAGQAMSFYSAPGSNGYSGRCRLRAGLCLGDGRPRLAPPQCRNGLHRPASSRRGPVAWQQTVSTPVTRTNGAPALQVAFRLKKGS